MNATSLLSRRTFSVCIACRRTLLRQFTSTRATPAAASFQSYPLHPQPSAQARNAVGQDTSIATAAEPPLPRVHETRPPKVAGGATPKAGDVSITEQEAQSSKTTFAKPEADAQSQKPSSSSSSTPTTSTTQPKPRSKLRTPRKAAMKLTPTAVTHLRELLDQPEPKLIKVGVRNRGCSGLAYHLEYVEKAGPFDEAVEQDGVRVLVDSKALFSIIGSEMDWVEDKLNERFVFRNPNIKEECGCGESFMV